MKGIDERLASVQEAMEVNKRAIDKVVGAAEKSVNDAVPVGSSRSDLEKAVGGIKKDVEGIKTDMKYALNLQISAVEKVLVAEVSSVKDAFKNIERIVIFAIVVFFFGKPLVLGVKEVVSSKN